jgi:hypothetical protein
MTYSTRTILTAVLFAAAVPALGQAQAQSAGSSGGNATATESKDTTKIPPARLRTQPPVVIQHLRPQDQRGLNVFEPPKEAGAPYTGFRLDWGAAFTQQMQGLEHSNTAQERLVNGVNQNRLMEIGTGFNNANANLYLNVQLAPGIRVALSSYLSSRHHNEMWVKDGYLLVDASPIDVPALNTLMEYVTLRLGHFEINYGDAHYRRTDNGNALYNPFVGNYLMDAFTTEIGAEVYFRAKGFMAMGGVTGGEVRGNVLRPDDRSFAYLGKLGYDSQLTSDLRVRLTGSVYTTDGSISNTLHSGDRAGSRYYYVLENTAAAEASQFRSGAIVPGFAQSVTAFQINPFVKFRGLELFGVAEQVEGKAWVAATATTPAAPEAESRTWNQYAADAVYRFLPGEPLYIGARYNKAEGELTGIANDVGADRWQFSGGWFITPSILLKGEYVTQKYNGFPATDIRNGGKFNGFMVEGVVAF